MLALSHILSTQNYFTEISVLLDSLIHTMFEFKYYNKYDKFIEIKCNKMKSTLKACALFKYTNISYNIYYIKYLH